MLQNITESGAENVTIAKHLLSGMLSRIKASAEAEDVTMQSTVSEILQRIKASAEAGVATTAEHWLSEML